MALLSHQTLVSCITGAAGNERGRRSHKPQRVIRSGIAWYIKSTTGLWSIANLRSGGKLTVYPRHFDMVLEGGYRVRSLLGTKWGRCIIFSARFPTDAGLNKMGPSTPGHIPLYELLPLELLLAANTLLGVSYGTTITPRCMKSPATLQVLSSRHGSTQAKC